MIRAKSACKCFPEAHTRQYDSFFEKDEDQEMYEKCTKPDEQNDTKSDSNHSALSPEISAIVDALQQNQGMAAAIMGMIKCMA